MPANPDKQRLPVTKNTDKISVSSKLRDTTSLLLLENQTKHTNHESKYRNHAFGIPNVSQTLKPRATVPDERRWLHRAPTPPPKCAKHQIVLFGAAVPYLSICSCLRALSS